MNMKTRIAKFLITLASFSLVTTVNAYQGNDCCNPCSYNPCCPSSNKSFFVGADYLYWSVHEDGLRFASPSFNDGCDCNCDCNCRDHDCDWNSGFKVSAGMANPCCDWELFVQYTWYRANPNKRVKGDGLVAYWGNLPVSSIIDHASGNWRFQFNNVDALITNEFCVNNCFTLRPSFGLKGAWINQRHCIGYDLAYLTNATGQPDFYGVQHRQNHWGVGPKVAVTAAASLFDCFSLYGNVGLSTLWSRFETKRHDFEHNASVVGEFVDVLSACHCRYRVNPVLETSFGLRWDTDLCCGDYGFYLQLAWEQQVWFDHNDFIDLDVNHNHGNLTLQGLTAGAGFSF